MRFKHSSSGSLRAMLLAVAFVIAIPVFAQPLLSGRVVDDAGILDAATEASITEKLAAFERKSSDQIVVATVRNLGGEAIEPYANRLFRSWGLGQAGENNGVLLLVAYDDRKMRIEVGYGLEGTLTDVYSRLIIENSLVPAFRAGDYSAGIARAVDDIILVLEGDGTELQARAERNRKSEVDVDQWIAIIFLVIWASIFFGSILTSLLAPIFGRKIGPRRYRWLGMDIDLNRKKRRSGSSGWVMTSGGGSSGGWSSGGGGFSGGGGSSGGGGASGSW